jgi:hypothetical protein
MDWFNRIADMLDARPRDEVVEGAYLAIRVMSHRAVVASRGISPQEFLSGEPSAGRALALEILKEVVSESGPINSIPQATVNSYIVALSQLVQHRQQRDLLCDEKLGRTLLEQMRKEDRLASSY